MDGTRLFVGNLPVNMTEVDVRSKFSQYGRVLKVELKERKFLQPPSCFGFITLDAPRYSLQNCISELSSHKAWNGHPVTVDFAKESFLSRLEKERLDPKNKNLIETAPSPASDSLPNATSAVGKKSHAKFNSKQNQESEDSESSEAESSGNDEAAKNVARKNVNCGNLKSAPKVGESENSETCSSSSEESDHDDIKNGNSRVKNNSPTSCPSRPHGKHATNWSSQLPTYQKKRTARTDETSSSEDSEGDHPETVNIRHIVNQSNDVMAAFEQFSSVWQDSDSEHNAPNDSSDDSIFEAFKKPETDGAAGSISFDDASPACDRGNTFASNKKDLSSESLSSGNKRTQFPSHPGGLSGETELQINNNNSKKGPNFVQSFPSINSRESNIHSAETNTSFPSFNGNKSDHSVKGKRSGFPEFSTHGDRTTKFKSAEENNASEGGFVNFVTNTRRNEARLETTVCQFDKAKPNTRNVKRSTVDAEAKRIHAMEERRRELLDRKNAVRQALSNVDSKHTSVSGGLNKKIIFSQDSDDEDQSDQPVIKTTNDQNKSNTFNHHTKTNDESAKSGEVSAGLRVDSRPFTTSGHDETRSGDDLIMSNKRKSLFHDESESEDDGETRQGEFKIKKQFEGEKGLKLLELQASYNNDTRFNLDDRFVEEEEKTADAEGVKRIQDEEEEGDEKERQMQILENVLGYKVKHHQTKNGLIQIPRFDPLNPDHKALFIPPKPKRDKMGRGRKTRRRDNPVEVSEEKFYQVDEEYFTSSKHMERTGEEPFSLLKMLNRDNDDVPASTSATTHNNLALKQGEYRAEPLGKSSHPFGSVGARFEYDSSDSDDEEEGDGAPLEVKGHSNEGATSDELKAQHGSKQGQFGTGLSEPPPVQGAGLIEKMFFVGQNDDRLKEAQAFWKQKPASCFASSGVDAFKLKRRALAVILKTKVRRSLKNATTSVRGNGGKRKKTTKLMKTQRRRS